jgi:hypothetical protein
MSEEYSINCFKQHYIEHRGIPADILVPVEEAFMAGAHTLTLMVVNALEQEEPKILIGKLTAELNDYMIKQAELEAAHATVH